MYSNRKKASCYRILSVNAKYTGSEREKNMSNETQTANASAQQSTKFCKHCGERIPANAVICTHCGCR